MHKTNQKQEKISRENGDGWYDKTDSIIANRLTNGLSSKEQVGETKYISINAAYFINLVDFIYFKDYTDFEVIII